MNINKENYEEYLFDYLEGNLSAEEHAELSKIIEQDEFLKAELKAFEQTVLVPSDDVVFPDIEKLLKKEKKTRVIPMYYYLSASVAAAIAILFVVVPMFKTDNAPSTTASAPDVIVTPDTNLNKQIETIDIAENVEKQEEQQIEEDFTPSVPVNQNKVYSPIKRKVERNIAAIEKLDPLKPHIYMHELPDYEIQNKFGEIKEFDLGTQNNTADNRAEKPTAVELDRFTAKQYVVSKVSGFINSLHKPTVSLFTKDDDGNKKFRVVVTYDNYQGIISFR